MQNKKEVKRKKKIAVFQIINIILSILAFSFIVSFSESRFVDAKLTNVQIPAGGTTTIGGTKSLTQIITVDNNNLKKMQSFGWDFTQQNLGDKMKFEVTKDSVTGTKYLLKGEDKWIDWEGGKELTPSQYPEGIKHFSEIGGDISPIQQNYLNQLKNSEITTTLENLPKGELSRTDWNVIKTFEKEGIQYVELENPLGEKRILDGAPGDTISESMGREFADIPYEGELYGGPLLGHITEGLWWSVMVVGMIQLIGPILGMENKQISAASKAAFGGIMSGKIAVGLITKFKPAWGRSIIQSEWGMGLSKAGAVGLGTGIAVAAIILYKTYEKESTQTVTFECEPWDAPVGGAHCEKCNEQGILPCSEYQCRSLGQACELLNPGTDDEKCVWVNKNDVKFPIIKPLDNALLSDYRYDPDNTISPPDRGVMVFNQDSTTGCAKAFTPLSFGVNLDEPAKCKLDYLRKDTFDEMQFYFGGSSLLKYNHTQVMSLPSPSSLSAENLTIENDGEFEVYVRCQDANGNHNTANFVFKYCVEKGPDTTPGLIVTTNLLNGMPIAYNQTEVDLEVYINEPADCKWSHLDQSYDNMEEEMTCSSSVLEMNAQMLYECSTTLTGIKSRVENKFYFRCKDQPSGEDRNVNSESYEFVLIGTQPLVIDSVLPNGTIKDSTDTVKVTLEAGTSAGYNEGEAVCYYSDTGDDDSYVMFFKTNSHKHSQDLWLTSGDYEYSIKCLDLGGNSDIEPVEFSVESDSSSPIIVRVYHEETYLKLVTNEKAKCVYDTVDCSYLFEDGTKTTTVDDTDHYTDWNIKTSFYVKCQDKYGNQPLPDQCSIIVRAFNSL